MLRTPALDRTDARRPLQLVLGILLFLVTQLLSVGGPQVLAVLAGDDLADGVPPWAMLVGACLAAAAALGGLLLIVGPIGGRPGLTLRGRGALRELLLGGGIGAVLIVLSAGLIMLAGGHRLVGIESAPDLLTPLAIGIHLVWNALQGGVFSSRISGTGEQAGLLRLEAVGPDWLTGGTMGVEGSVVTVVMGLSAGIVMLVLAHRRGHLLPRVRRTAPAYPEGDLSVTAARSPR